MKYKQGDRVRIKSLDWYNENKDSSGEVVGTLFDARRSKFCGTIQTIANNGALMGSGIVIYAIEDAYEFIGEEAIEGLAEDDTAIKSAMPPTLIGEEAIEGLAEDDTAIKSAMPPTLNGEEVMQALKQHELPSGSIKIWDLPDGHIFKDENGNVINATKIVLEKKKKEYPKTYDECAKVAPMTWGGVNFEHYNNLLSSFYKLLGCRDAYWKIAGRERGQRKSWKPDFESGASVFIITTVFGEISKAEYLGHLNHILAFPTAEMRDAFYENFKELIEICKELL